MDNKRGSAILTWQPIRDNRREGWAPNWHLVVERRKNEAEWLAFIEPFWEGERISTSVTFDELSAAMEWCCATVAQYDPRIAMALGLITPTPDRKLRDQILNQLRQYDIETAFWLIEKVLTLWGEEHRQITLTLNEYGGQLPFSVSKEPAGQFWNALCKMEFDISFPILSQGSIHLDTNQRDDQAREWVNNLALPPFYETVYTFALAVYDWMITSDLRSFSKNFRRKGQGSDNQLDAIRDCLRVWGSNLGVD